MSDSTSLSDQAVQVYREQFGAEPTWITAAPGRVNLIGEHTDYNDGFVLPMAIDRYTVVAAGPTDPDFDSAEVFSTLINGSEQVPLEEPNLDLPTWAKYVQGVVQVFRNEGIQPGAFRAVIDSTVPLGGGLSSSAALEVAVATLFERMLGKELDTAQKALYCQRAEHEGVGTPCGIMDQFSSAFGKTGQLMLLDCRSQEIQYVPMADPNIAVLIVNSNVKHELAGGEYAERRAQCEAAEKALGVDSLRDVTEAEVAAAESQLDKTVFQRARHVVGEIARTTEAADALKAGDWNRVGELMYASHTSLRDDYEVSCPELDMLVDIAKQCESDGVIGSRMTGGGFGGCTVSLVKTAGVDKICSEICSRYQQQSGIKPDAFVTTPSQGAHVITG